MTNVDSTIPDQVNMQAVTDESKEHPASLSVADLSSEHKKAKAALVAVLKIKKDIENNSAEIKSSLDEIKQVIEATKTSLTELESLNLKATSAFESINVIEKNAVQSEIDLTECNNGVLAQKKKFEELMTGVEECHSAAISYHSELFDDEKNGNGTIANFSIKTKIADFVSQINNEFTRIQETHNVNENKLSSLDKEIRSLLPDAAAAGLASGYFESKKRYGKVNYGSHHDSNLRNVIGWIRYNVSNNASTLFNYLLFIGPLIVIFAFFSGTWLFSNGVDVLNVDAKTILFRVAVSVPLLLISYFGMSSISLNRRLYEEYNHKQRVMQLFHGFKETISSEGTDEHRTKLLGIMLDVVGDKPSLIMPKYENSGFWHFMIKLFEVNRNKDKAVERQLRLPTGKDS